MTAAQYADLQATLQTILQNQKAIYDKLASFEDKAESELHLLRMGQDTGYATTRAVDGRCELLEEEVRIIKSLLAQQVLPRLGAEFPDGHIPLKYPGPQGLPRTHQNNERGYS